MTEWHVTPDYIVNNWTDELFDLMVEKFIERKKREIKPSSEISDDAKLAMMGDGIKVIKKHGD